MKIAKNIILNHKAYSSLSDSTLDALADPSCLFVKTTMNAKYHHQISSQASIEEEELKKFFIQKPKLIGITGTNGKTTTASMIAHILMQNHYKVALLGTRGFFINGVKLREKGLTTPTILELYSLIEEAQECDFFVMEVSSHAIVQNRIKGLRFDAKILTNITSDHLDFHHSLEEYIRVKNSFFTEECLQIINSSQSLCTAKTKITYGLNQDDDVFASHFSIAPTIYATISSKNQNAPLALKMCGKHNLYNALACIACVLNLTALDLPTITASLQNFEGVEGRMEMISTSPLIIVDFAHTHDGMEKILESFEGKNNILLFGAGGDRDKSKRPKMGKVAEKYAKKIYLTSDNPRSEDPQVIIEEIQEGIQDKSKIISKDPDRKKSIQKAISELQKDEILFVLGKGDEAYQIIQDKKIPFDDREIIKAVLESQMPNKK